MSAYEELAWSYDELTTDVDYPGLLQYLRRVLDKLDKHPQTALDLACGTGSMTVLLAQGGLNVIGADCSEDMLSVAYDKALSLPVDCRPLFIRQTMQALELPQPVDLVVCLLDSLNYLADPADGAEAIRRVYASLTPGGVFLFDVNSLKKFRAMDGQVWLDETDDSYCVWRTEFSETENLCRYGVDLFRRQGELWQRSFEEHVEYAYSPEQLETMLNQAGFSYLERFGDRTLEPPAQGDMRWFFAAVK